MAGKRNADAGHCVEGECGQHHDGLDELLGIKIKDVVGRRIKITPLPAEEGCCIT